MPTAKNLISTALTLIIPMLYLAWGIIVLLGFDPFYARTIDPEFPYLINGMNAGIPNFNRIGHVDHPGTPFQLFNGIIIRLTHFFLGNGNMVSDVLNRPQHYIMAISMVLLALQVILTYAIGFIGQKKGLSALSIIVLQSSLLFSDLLMWMFSRAVPERWLMVTSYIFILVFLKHGFQQQSLKKFAIYSGIVMGMGLATKLNYLPLLFLPLFLLKTHKQRFIFEATSMLSFFVFISPVIDKMKYFRQFITSIITHDGIYGQGEKRIFNIEKIIEGVKSMFHISPMLILLLVILLTGLALGIVAYIKNRKNQNLLIVSFGFILVFSLQVLMVAKHFKFAYLTPLLSIIGFMLFIITYHTQLLFQCKKTLNIFLIVVTVIFSAITLHRMSQHSGIIIDSMTMRNEIREFVDQKIPKNAYWFIEPTWESAPHKENALCFGLAYCRHKEDYLEQMMEINPNVITYENNTEFVKLWMCRNTSLDSVIATGQPLHIYSTPGRHAPILMGMVSEAAKRNNFEIKTDTLFAQTATQSYIISIKAINSNSNWTTQNPIFYSRESDIEQIKLNLRNSSEWLKEIEKKAIQNGISLDSMLTLDAIWLLENK